MLPTVEGSEREEAFIRNFLTETEYDYVLREGISETLFKVSSVRNVGIGAGACLLIQLTPGASTEECRREISCLIHSRYPSFPHLVTEDIRFEYHDPSVRCIFESPFNRFCTTVEHDVANIAFIINQRFVTNFHCVCETPNGAIHESAHMDAHWKKLSLEQASEPAIYLPIRPQITGTCRCNTTPEPLPYAIVGGTYDDSLDIAYSEAIVSDEYLESIVRNNDDIVVRRSWDIAETSWPNIRKALLLSKSRFFMKLIRHVPSRSYPTALEAAQLQVMSELELQFQGFSWPTDQGEKRGALIFRPMDIAGTTEAGDCGSLVVARMYSAANDPMPESEFPVGYHYMRQSAGRLFSIPITTVVRYMRDHGLASGSHQSVATIQRFVHVVRPRDPEE